MLIALSHTSTDHNIHNGYVLRQNKNQFADACSAALCIQEYPELEDELLRMNSPGGRRKMELEALYGVGDFVRFRTFLLYKHGRNRVIC